MLNLRLGTLVLLTLAPVASARGQDPVAAYPKNYSVALDNDLVTVVRVRYGPREKLGVHDHSKNPTVYVYLSDSGPVRFQHFEEQGFTLTRPATANGAFRISPGRLEQHSVENLGETSSDFLRVELKQIPLGRFKQAFRGAAPKSLSEIRASVEFKSPFVEVQRVICAGPQACSIDPAPAPSLIVAFTEVLEQQTDSLEPGAVRWLPSTKGLTIASRTGSAHLLRILVPPSAK